MALNPPDCPPGLLCSPSYYKARDNLAHVPGQCELPVAEIVLRARKRRAQQQIRASRARAGRCRHRPTGSAAQADAVTSLRLGPGFAQRHHLRRAEKGGRSGCALFTRCQTDPWLGAAACVYLETWSSMEMSQYVKTASALPVD